MQKGRDAAGPSDLDLMRAYQRGDEEAFAELFRRYSTRLYNYFLRHLGDQAMAEDLLQETFLKIHLHRRSYEPRAELSAWIFTIATNLMRNAAASAYRRRSVQESARTGRAADETSAILPAVKSPEEEFSEREVGERVRRAVASLPPHQREIILLAKYEGFKFEEIGTILGIPAATAKVRAHRAVKALAAMLREATAAPGEKSEEGKDASPRPAGRRNP